MSMPINVLIVLWMLAGLLGALLLWMVVVYRQQRTQGHAHADWLIVYASQTGSAQAWATHTAQQLTAIEHTCCVIDIQTLQAAHLQQHRQVLWLVSTYGDGDAPDHARAFVKQMLPASLDLSHVAYAVLAFGDRRYSQFCQFGQVLSTWLEQQQAAPLFPMICVDHLHPHDLQRWTQALEQVTEQRLEDHQPATPAWQTLTLSRRELMNAWSLGEPIYQIGLRAAPELRWTSGDIVELQCHNPPEHIEAWLQQRQLSANPAQVQALRTVNLRLFNPLGDWVAALAQAEQLPTREYSIASLPSTSELELVVRAQPDGLGSGLLTQYAALGSHFAARIRSNPSFHLPHDDRPLIFIGNGTGIAGLIGHLRLRAARGHHDNWLIFGERQQQFDHLYQAQLALWHHNDVLRHVDYAFSRDQAERLYVQDRLRQRADRLHEWIKRGAAIYVCGSLAGMASGVEQVLIELLGEEMLDTLRLAQRYQRDVY